MRALVPATIVASVLLLVAPALAQPQPSADQLFQEGVRLFQRGETRTACERFAASYKIDAAPGTLYNLAACHEKDGKLWQARLEFLDLAERAANVGKQDKVRVAQERVKAIEARLPALKLQLPPSSNVASITVDGTALAPGVWGSPVPVEDGVHALAFTAPGKVAQSTQIEVHGAGQQATVVVPVLPDEPGAAPAPSVQPPGPAPAAADATVSPAPGGSSTRTVGFVIGGVGVAALATGAVFGVLALGQKSDADKACGGQGSVCPDAAHTSDAQSKLQSARTSGLVSTVGLGVGIVAAGLGAYFILTGGSSGTESPRAALAVTPTGAWLEGGF